MNLIEGGGEARRRPPLDDASKAEVARLATEVYGEDAETFMSTPRASIGMRSPAAAIADGDVDQVLDLLIRSLLGDWQ